MKHFCRQNASQALLREKILYVLQSKVLDISRPLLFFWATTCLRDSTEDLDAHAAAVNALRLWGHCFESLTEQ